MKKKIFLTMIKTKRFWLSIFSLCISIFAFVIGCLQIFESNKYYEMFKENNIAEIMDSAFKWVGLALMIVTNLSIVTHYRRISLDFLKHKSHK